MLLLLNLTKRLFGAFAFGESHYDTGDPLWDVKGRCGIKQKLTPELLYWQFYFARDLRDQAALSATIKAWFLSKPFTPIWLNCKLQDCFYFFSHFFIFKIFSFVFRFPMFSQSKWNFNEAMCSIYFERHKCQTLIEFSSEIFDFAFFEKKFSCAKRVISLWRVVLLERGDVHADKIDFVAADNRSRARHVASSHFYGFCFVPREHNARIKRFFDVIIKMRLPVCEWKRHNFSVILARKVIHRLNLTGSADDLE